MQNLNFLSAKETIFRKPRQLFQTPSDFYYEISLDQDSISQSFSKYLKSFSSQLAEDHADLKRVHFQVYYRSAGNKTPVFNSENLPWGKVLRHEVNRAVDQKILLDQITITVSSNVKKENNQLPTGFSEKKILHTSPAFVAILISGLNPHLVERINEKFPCVFNDRLLLIHLAFPRFDEVEEIIIQMGLTEDIHYNLVDTTTIQEGSTFKSENKWLKFYLDSDQKFVKVIG